MQAVARLWRIGQQREVHAYRLICKGTLGDKTYARSVDKESLFKRAIDKKTVKGMLRMPCWLWQRRFVWPLCSTSSSTFAGVLSHPCPPSSWQILYL